MKIAIIGCGNMGQRLADKLCKDHELYLFDKNTAKVEKLIGKGVFSKSIKEAVKSAEMVILAIKPQALNDTANEIKNSLKKGQIFVSLLAGTPIIKLKELYPVGAIVRLMPNLAMTYSEAVVGLCANTLLSEEEKIAVAKVFEKLGEVFWVPENKIDALTALAASGPAFVFAIYEAMVDAGVAMGFSAQDSIKLVSQMLKGSLSLLENTHKHPGELKWQVASPGGTTIAGLKKLEESGLRGHVINTFLAAYERAKELSEEV